MNETEIKNLISKMGETIDEKIKTEIKENNKKIVSNVMLFMQVLIVIAVGFLEFNK